MTFLRYTLFMTLLAAFILASPLGYHFMKGNLTAHELPPKTKPDAVMVFTGSPERIAQGYKYYLKGLGKKLMISGNDYPKESRAKDVRKLSRKVGKDKVYVDLKATNTIENAKNGAQWAIKNNVKSILLVTTEDHVPRAYFELRRLLPPDVKIYTGAVGGDIDYPGLDSETGRLLCRVYETTSGTSFCYKTRKIVRNIERHLT